METVLYINCTQCQFDKVSLTQSVTKLFPKKSRFLVKTYIDHVTKNVQQLCGSAETWLERKFA